MPFRDSKGNLIGILGMTKDITNQRRQQEWFQLAVNSAGDGLWYHDVVARTRWYSSRWKEMLGYSNTELMDHNLQWREFVVDEDREIVDATLAKCNAQKPDFTYLCRMRHKNQKVILVRCRGRGTFDRQGKVTAFAGSHSDITELQDQEDFYRLLLDTVPSFIFAKDRDFRFQYVNQAMAKAIGKSRDTLIGTSDDEHFERRLVEQFRRIDEEVFRTGLPQDIKFEVFSLPNEDERYLATVKVPLWKTTNTSNVPDGIVGVATDITDLLAAQDMLDTLLENIAEGVFFKDAEGKFIRVSSALAQFVKAHSAEEMIGKTDADYFHSSFVEEASEVDKRVLGGESVLGLRVKSVLVGENPAEVHRWRQVSKVPFTNARNEIIGQVGISLDITAIEVTRAELERKTELLTAILDAIPQKIFVKDGDGKYLLCNRAFATSHGLASPNEVVGTSDYDRWDNAQVEQIRKTDIRVMDNNRSEHFPEQIVDRAGRLRRMITSKIPLHDDTAEKAVGVLGIYDDVSPEFERERERTCLPGVNWYFN